MIFFFNVCFLYFLFLASWEFGLIPFTQLPFHHFCHGGISFLGQCYHRQSQLVQPAKARKCKDEEIIELPPVTCNIDAPTFTRLNLVMHEVLPTLWSSISALKKPNPMALIVGVFGTPALEVADQFHMLKYVFVSSTWSHAVILYLLLTSAWQRNSTTTTTIPGFQRTNKNMRDLLGVLGLWACELC